MSSFGLGQACHSGEWFLQKGRCGSALTRRKLDHSIHQYSGFF